MHGTHWALAWGRLDIRFLGRAARRIFSCKPCVAADRNLFAEAALLGTDFFVRGDLLGVFPRGDVRGRLADNIRDVWVVFADVGLEYA